MYAWLYYKFFFLKLKNWTSCGKYAIILKVEPFFKFLKSIFSLSSIAPLVLIALYLVFLVFIRGALPTAQEIIDHFASIYERYGYEIIFVSAALESLVLVNLFVPGLVAMALGAIFARTGHIELTLVVLAATSGVLLGYIIDYFLGYFGFGDFFSKTGLGWMVKKAREQLNKLGTHGLILGFAYPNVASFLSLAAGTVKMRFGWFLLIAILSSAFWMPIWGIVIYSLGDIFLTVLTKYSFLIVLVVATSLILVRIWRKR